MFRFAVNNKIMEDKLDFLKLAQDNMTNEFWNENYKKIIIGMIENGYKKEVTDHWGISDIVINGDKVLLKWYKRINPIT